MKSTALLSQSNAPAGLGSISHAEAGNSSYVFDSSAGAGIVAYVVDTGIRTTHSVSCAKCQQVLTTNLQGIPRSCNLGRKHGEHNCELIVPVISSSLTFQNTDENGHGSHVSGTIAGATYGVAKSASLVAVKVLDGDGAGTTSGVIAGINFGQ